MTQPIAPFRILLVCTGNICRSPILEVLLKRDIQTAGLNVAVESAGLISSGDRADEFAENVMTARGIDLESHRSRTLGEVVLGDFDLILGLAREHVRSVAVEDPAVYRRMFTVKELVRRSGEIGNPQPPESFSVWLRRAQEERTIRAHLGASPLDDVADPHGSSISVFEQSADELASLSEILVSLMCDSALR